MNCESPQPREVLEHTVNKCAEIIICLWGFLLYFTECTISNCQKQATISALVANKNSLDSLLYTVRLENSGWRSSDETEIPVKPPWCVVGLIQSIIIDRRTTVTHLLSCDALASDSAPNFLLNLNMGYSFLNYSADMWIGLLYEWSVWIKPSDPVYW